MNFQNNTNNTSTAFDIHQPNPQRNNIIDASKLFSTNDKKFETTGNDEKVEESVLIAKDFPLKVDLPLYINKGEKVTIRIIREQTNYTSTMSGPKLTPNEKPLVSSPIPISTMGENVDNIFNTNKAKNDKIIINEENKEIDLMTQQRDYFIKILTKVQNTAITVSLIVGFLFIFLAFIKVISVPDSIFVLLISSTFGFLMFFDKLYRRTLNNAKVH
ncbi:MULTISPECIES: hypothetical protein [unclassified Peribacillus]|uniref:hypothetical protein n=1 Tax=unclassified Peribacillus TaxID=2675266 RepID=UPI0036710A1C